MNLSIPNLATIIDEVVGEGPSYTFFNDVVCAMAHTVFAASEAVLIYYSLHS